MSRDHLDGNTSREISRSPNTVQPRSHSEWPRWVLSSLIIPLCWFGMQGIHELGHVFGAWITGGTVIKVVLHPAAISRTDVTPNPNPLIEVWAGPWVGVILPLLLWGMTRTFRLRSAFVFQFFAGFCLIANGVYLGAGSFDHVGDCGDLLTHGTPHWQLWGFGLIATPLGLCLWHGLGRQFGWGRAANRVDSTLALGVAGCLVTLVVAELLLSGTF